MIYCISVYGMGREGLVFMTWKPSIGNSKMEIYILKMEFPFYSYILLTVFSTILHSTAHSVSACAAQQECKTPRNMTAFVHNRCFAALRVRPHPLTLCQTQVLGVTGVHLYSTRARAWENEKALNRQKNLVIYMLAIGLMTLYIQQYKVAMQTCEHSLAKLFQQGVLTSSGQLPVRYELGRAQCRKATHLLCTNVVVLRVVFMLTLCSTCAY